MLRLLAAASLISGFLVHSQDVETVRKLIQELNDPDRAGQAESRLIEIGPAASPELEGALKSGTPEFQVRIRKILREIELTRLADARPRGKEAVVLSLWQVSGLWTPKQIEEYAKHPRFALYGDGTVVYRGGDAQYRRVVLTDAETRSLVRSVLEKGLLDLDLKKLCETPDKPLGPPPTCGSIDRIEIALTGRSAKLDYSSSHAWHLEQHPADRNLRALVEIHALLWSWSREEAKPCDPDREAERRHR